MAGLPVERPAPWPTGRIAPPPALSPDVLSLAENSNLHHPLGPTDERLVDSRYVVYLGPGSFAGFTVVQRLRLRPDEVEPTVAEIRAELDRRGRLERTWEIGCSATPGDLTERLLDLGMEPDQEPYAVGMVLDRPPAPAPAHVEVRRVSTIEDYRTSVRIAMDAFGMSDDGLGEMLERADADWSSLAASRSIRQYLALIDGEPVATGRATWTEPGVLLNGGSTIERARGRGAYRALVGARWNDAAAEGRPVLVTQAGAMSRPILARLGFREVCDIRILLDRSDRAGGSDPPEGASRPSDG
jgi:hypothetical protein